MNLKDGVYLAFAAALCVALVWCGHRIVSYGDVKAERDALSARVDKLEKDDARYDKALADKAEREQVARQGRQAIEYNLDRNARNDPTTAAYLDARIPDGVRNAFLGADSASGGSAGANGGRGPLPDHEGRYGGPAVDDAGRSAPRTGGG